MSALPVTSLDRRPIDSSHLRLSVDELSCEVVRSFESIQHLRSPWDRLAKGEGSCIYCTFDWCKVWWDHYGQEDAAHINLYYVGEELVGVVPLYIDTVRLGPTKLRIAKIIGSDYTQAVCDLPISSSWSKQIAVETIQRLFGQGSCDAFATGPISASSGALLALKDAVKERSDMVSMARDRAEASQTIISLPDSLDTYVASLSKNQRSNLRKEWRRLDKAFEIQTDVISDPSEAAAEFEKFVHMHEKQWRTKGKLGHFGDWPNAMQFNRSLVAALSEIGRLCLFQLKADGRVIARQYSLLFGDTCHCRFAARMTGLSWESLGLGRVSLSKLFERMIDEGVSRVDAGTGRYEYKLRLGGKEQGVRSLLIVANRQDVKKKVRVFCTMADLLHRCYYRLWFCRIAPRMPFRSRSLWKLWIRSRV